jgi:hypothetical protein
VADDGPASGVEGEGARLNIPQKKKRQEGARAPLTVEEFMTAEAAGQRRWRARTATVSSRHGQRCSWDGRGRGEATARLGQRGVGGRKGCRDAGVRSR